MATVVVAPMAFASHTYPVGSLRNWCESDLDDLYHEYGPSTGFAISPGIDGNVQGDCDGDPNTVADYDGHVEFAFGGAWLTAAASPGCNDGDSVDHAAFPTVWVGDHVLNLAEAPVSFSVYADTLNNVPPVDPAEPNCGDFESDYGADCTNECAVPFPPGLDGTYQVYVTGTSGSVGTGNPRACTSDWYQEDCWDYSHH